MSPDLASLVLFSAGIMLAVAGLRMAFPASMNIKIESAMEWALTLIVSTVLLVFATAFIVGSFYTGGKP